MSPEDFDAFLMKNVFADLSNLNTGFDHASISHFSRDDFVVVLDRCDRLHVQLNAIEVFVNKVEFIECVIAQDDEYGWARRLIDEYRQMPEISFSATYSSKQIGE